MSWSRAGLKHQLQSQAWDNDRVEELSAWPGNLEIERKTAPGGNGVIVKQLDSVLVLLWNTGCRQGFETVAESKIEVTDPEDIERTTRDHGSTGEAAIGNQLHRVGIAVRGAELAEDPPVAIS